MSAKIGQDVILDAVTLNKLWNIRNFNSASELNAMKCLEKNRTREEIVD